MAANDLENSSISSHLLISFHFNTPPMNIPSGLQEVMIMFLCESKAKQCDQGIVLDLNFVLSLSWIYMSCFACVTPGDKPNIQSCFSQSLQTCFRKATLQITWK